MTVVDEEKAENRAFVEKFLHAVAACQARLAVLLDSGTSISPYYEFPTMSTLSNGFPTLSLRTQFLTGVTDYGKAFRYNETSFGGPIQFDEVERPAEFMAYCRGNARFRQKLVRKYGDGAVDDDQLIDIRSALLVLDVVDRATHLYGTEADAEKTTEVIFERLHPLFLDELNIDLVVPVVLTGFEADKPFFFETSASLEPIDEKAQLARTPGRFLTHSVHETVLGAATHALVLHNRTIPAGSENWHHLPEFYPVDRINTFFTALRISTGVSTGYAQVLIRPVGWGEHWLGGLPAIQQGATLKRYPDSFENYGWNTDRPVVTADQLEQVRVIWQQINEAGNRVQLACRRFSMADTRSDDDDRLLDLCIALEALFGDRQGETTYKLSLRTAGVLAESKEQSVEIFRTVKDLYGERSDIVHGNDRKSWKHGGSPSDVASEYVRRSLSRVLSEPDLASTKKLDDRLAASAASMG